MRTFDGLSDYDFELLVCDLLSAEWGVHVESFPRGRDGGVDLRVLGPASAPLHLEEKTELVVQCKHRPNATFSQLQSELKAEAVKAKALSPDRYMLVTSARLTRANKDKIVELFDGIIKRPDDILGSNDLDSLLNRNVLVERANFKLWLSSAEILQTVLHQVENVRSSTFVAQLLRLRDIYVETPELADAAQRLERDGVCILAGPPGVGKSAMARVLLLRYLSDGWRPAIALSEVRELEVQLLPSVRQILFFDDFLGQDSLDAKLKKGEDSELDRLVEFVSRDESKVLILTTRDYIYKFAQQRYEKLHGERFDRYKMTLSAEGMSVETRAHLLYNQLYYSGLRELARHTSKGRARFMLVVQHRNYNPRLVQEAISALERDLKKVTASRSSVQSGELPSRISERYLKRDSRQMMLPVNDASFNDPVDVPSYLLDALDRPGELWEHVLRYQLTEIQQAVLFVRASFGRGLAKLDCLYAAVRSFRNQCGSAVSTMELDDAMLVLDGDLLSIESVGSGRSGTLIQPIRPGLSDAVHGFLARYSDITLKLAQSATYFSQVEWLVAAFLSERKSSRSVQLEGSKHEISDVIMRSAERLLDSVQSSVSRDGYAFPQLQSVALQSPFYDFGARLRVLDQVYDCCDAEPSRLLPDKVLAEVAKRISLVGQRNYETLADVLRNGSLPTFWHSRRTDVEVAILKDLAEPDDIDSWTILRDVLDIIPASGEFVDDLELQLEEFFDDQRMHYESLLEDEENEGEEESEVQDLIDLADRWAMDAGMDDLIEQAEINQERSRPQGQVQAPAGQMTLFGEVEELPRRPAYPLPTRPVASIFDSL